MNANELADVLDKTGWYKRFTEWDLLDEAATMLRKQQAEIYSIKGMFVKLADENNKLKDELDTANKAYMWMDETYKGKLSEIKALKKEKGHIGACPNSDGANSFAKVSQSIIAKTLTDEEIIEISNAVTNLIDSNEGWIEFARAILRKAQEK